MLSQPVFALQTFHPSADAQWSTGSWWKVPENRKNDHSAVTDLFTSPAKIL